MAEVFELAEARVNLLASQPQGAAQAKILDGKAGEDGAIHHGAAEVRLGNVARPGKITHEASGKAVSGARRVANFLQRITRHLENEIRGVKAHAVLAALDGDNART